MAKIHFGMEVSNTLPWPNIKNAALSADKLRWRAIYTYDHLMPCTADELPLTVSSVEDCENGPIFEGWTLLAALACLTNKVRLGSMVSSCTMRHPALLAKTAVTVDHISSGRVDLGLGSGWHEPEHLAYGISLGSMRERSDRLEEGAKIIRMLFDNNQRASFQGKYFNLDNAPFFPKPIDKLPLLIAGGGEKRTLRTVANWADASNLYVNVFSSYEELVHKYEVLEEHCLKIGRDPKEIRRTVTMYADIEHDPKKAKQRRMHLGQHLYDEEAEALPIGEPQRIIDQAALLIDLNVDEIIFNGPDPTPEKLEQLDSEVLSYFD